MSAGRNASNLLFALLATAVLFVVLIGVTSLPPLSKHSYDLGYGWDQPSGTVLHDKMVCSTKTRGFPLVSSRVIETPTLCQDQTNPLAKDLNLALCFAVACVIAVGVVNVGRGI